MKRSLHALVLVFVLCLGLCGCMPSNIPSGTEPNNVGTSSIDITQETEVETTVEEAFPETTETTAETTVAETTVETTAETEHRHTFAEATCTKPETCTECGQTQGKAAGHDWEAATCKAPKTCSVCDKTTGSAAAHDYEDGECRWCGKSKPSSGGKNMVWIPTKGGKKYHSKETCSNMEDPEQVTKDEAEDLGFTPCKKCYK